jgi:GTP-binding protein Era
MRPLSHSSSWKQVVPTAPVQATKTMGKKKAMESQREVDLRMSAASIAQTPEVGHADRAIRGYAPSVMVVSEDHAAEPRSGRCAIVGRPNVGKSTLLNAILGQKLVIATPRPGTTRSCVLGVYASADPPTQIAFVDTPGLERPKGALGHVLIDSAKQGLLDCDAILFVTEAPKASAPTAVHEKDLAVLEAIEASKAPVVLAINKVDKLKAKNRLFAFIEAYQEKRDFAAVVPISATRGTNLDALLREIRATLPEGLLYDPDFLTDRPERFFVSELVREAAMLNTRQEVPYGIACELDSYQEEGDLVRIEGTLVVEKPSHKAIVIGSRGETIKKISTEAREQIEALVERKVYLRLWVKVVPGWTRDPLKARELAIQGGQG